MLKVVLFMPANETLGGAMLGPNNRDGNSMIRRNIISCVTQSVSWSAGQL